MLSKPAACTTLEKPWPSDITKLQEDTGLYIQPQFQTPADLCQELPWTLTIFSTLIRKFLQILNPGKYPIRDEISLHFL